MSKIYKLKATFEAMEYDDFYEEEEWEEESDTVSIEASSQEEAEKLATDLINEDHSAIRHLSFEVIEAAEIPLGTIVLQRNLVSDCGRYALQNDNGYILIERELAFTLAEEESFTNPFAGYESRLGLPLGEYAVTPRQTAVFEAGLLWVEYVRKLNKIGVLVCAVSDSEWPFALSKDGRYVGIVMPIHGTQECSQLDTLEQRHKFIEAQRESGGVYNQVS